MRAVFEVLVLAQDSHWAIGSPRSAFGEVRMGLIQTARAITLPCRQVLWCLIVPALDV